MKRKTGRITLQVCALLGMIVAGNAMAADIRYSGNGDYMVPGKWIGGVLPGAADAARFSFASNTVTLSAVAPTVLRFQMGVDESGGLVVNNGGVLTSTSSSTVGNNAGGGGATPTTGFLVINSGGIVNAGGSSMKVSGGLSAAPGNLKGIVSISGGTLNVSGHLWLGSANNTVGILDINSGGVLNMLGTTGNMLGLGTVDGVSASGGKGFLNVNDGGTLNLFNIQATALGSIQSGSLLDISGSGVVTIPGNFTSVMNDYISGGRITGNDVVGNVQAVFDGGQNKTFLTVVPEPSSLALMALAGLAMATRRSRRN